MAAMAEPTAAVVAPPPAERREPEALEFPGCHPVRIRRDELDVGDFRIEYWDADTEIAMICEPVSYYHERPASRLARLAGLIAAARGAAIEAAGHTDLLVRNARGERQRIMQADQILFLRPAQAEPAGNAIEVGTDALPDVVLEVDNTTDVRRNKLKLYESWGFGTRRSSCDWRRLSNAARDCFGVTAVERRLRRRDRGPLQRIPNAIVPPYPASVRIVSCRPVPSRFARRITSPSLQFPQG